MRRTGFKRVELPPRSAFVPPARDVDDVRTIVTATDGLAVLEMRGAEREAAIAAEALERIFGEKYLAFLRTQPCVGCGKLPPNRAHHRWGEPGTLKGMSMKSPDSDAVPLCETIGTYYGCHERWHHEQRFEGKTKQESIEMMERARVELREEFVTRTHGCF